VALGNGEELYECPFCGKKVIPQKKIEISTFNIKAHIPIPSISLGAKVKIPKNIKTYYDCDKCGFQYEDVSDTDFFNMFTLIKGKNGETLTDLSDKNIKQLSKYVKIKKVVVDDIFKYYGKVSLEELILCHRTKIVKRIPNKWYKRMFYEKRLFAICFYYNKKRSFMDCLQIKDSENDIYYLAISMGRSG
jgi:predicted RNA-binding Zn-ribbon protein involved in translation (DUF1610 family)